MNYFKDESGAVYAYDDEQVAQGYGADMTAMAPEEIDAHLNSPKTEAQIRSEWKASRAAAVEAIKVTTAAGNTFDGDETSQGRMARAIVAMQAVGPDASVTWVLADNTVISATAAELSEALALAGAEQARLWVAP